MRCFFALFTLYVMGVSSFSGRFCVNVIGDFGELKVALTTCTKTTVRINQGDRIAQLLIVPVSMLDCIEVDSLDDTARGAGGFGSTGR